MIVNASYNVNGVGILERQGWPVDNVYLFIGGGALVGFLVGIIRSVRQRDHARQVAELSSELGFIYSAEVTRDDVKAMPLFNNWSNGSHRMSGQRDGVSVQILDFTAVERSGESSRTTHQTVALLEADGLPEFSLRPRTLGMRLLGLRRIN